MSVNLFIPANLWLTEPILTTLSVSDSYFYFRIPAISEFHAGWVVGITSYEYNCNVVEKMYIRKG